MGTEREESICNIFSNKECIEKIYHPICHGMEFVAWGKLYKTSLFKNNEILYPVGKIHEDTFTTYKLLYYAERIVYVDYVGYFYRQRENSIISDDEYHCFIVGSDQVWNPDWAKYTYDRMFLRFCSPTKRISYAASFGVDKIPEKWVDKYKAGLIDFKALSVREDKAVDIVKNTIGITCHKVLDPTMLLERAEWDKIKKMPTKINGKNYILTYFLGGRTREVEKVIYRYAKLTDSAVINLQDYNTPYYTVGPDEFVGLISKAKMVLTDSFHATVFSIIYEKPFVVYDRQGSGKKMGSRLSSLLEMCGLNNRRASALDEKMLLQVDYTNARLAIQKEKVCSLKYLNEAIQSCGDSVG